MKTCVPSEHHSHHPPVKSHPQRQQTTRVPLLSRCTSEENLQRPARTRAPKAQVTSRPPGRLRRDPFRCSWELQPVCPGRVHDSHAPRRFVFTTQNQATRPGSSRIKTPAALVMFTPEEINNQYIALHDEHFSLWCFDVLSRGSDGVITLSAPESQLRVMTRVKRVQGSLFSAAAAAETSHTNPNPHLLLVPESHQSRRRQQREAKCEALIA